MRVTYFFAAILMLTLGARAEAAEMRWGGKLLLTRGVASVEGAGGGGLAAWALITGDETDDGVGGEAHATLVQLPDYQLRAYGGGVGLFDRAEVTYTRQNFDTGVTGAKLGLGRGFTFDQDVVGAKLRLFGDAVYDQDRWTPQVAVGIQYKHNDQAAVLHAVGARRADGVDVYVAATKVLLDSNLVLDGTVRLTKANQIGLLGFGGDRGDRYAPEIEASAGYLLSKRLLIGAEYRSKPDNLGFARERDWFDLFGAVAINQIFSVTAAYVDAGPIASFRNQRGLYLSLQAGF